MSDSQLTGDAKDRLLKWALSDDHCVPTMTMAGAALGLSPVELRTGYFSYPKGIAEFGRCYGLLQAVPELRQAFPLVAVACPKFKPILDAWDELVGLFECDREACYRRITELTETMGTSGEGTWRNP